jgi:LPXTG-motif cell wall-anchored protein
MEKLFAATEGQTVGVETTDVIALAIGAVLIVLGAWLFRRTLPAREKPDPVGFPVTPEPATP